LVTRSLLPPIPATPRSPLPGGDGSCPQREQGGNGPQERGAARPVRGMPSMLHTKSVGSCPPGVRESGAQDSQTPTPNTRSDQERFMHPMPPDARDSDRTGRVASLAQLAFAAVLDTQTDRWPRVTSGRCCHLHLLPQRSKLLRARHRQRPHAGARHSQRHPPRRPPLMPHQMMTRHVGCGSSVSAAAPVDVNDSDDDE
jgi:hypothetical protein